MWCDVRPPVSVTRHPENHDITRLMTKRLTPLVFPTVPVPLTPSLLASLGDSTDGQGLRHILAQGDQRTHQLAVLPRRHGPAKGAHATALIPGSNAQPAAAATAAEGAYPIILRPVSEVRHSRHFHTVTRKTCPAFSSGRLSPSFPGIFSAHFGAALSQNPFQRESSPAIRRRVFPHILQAGCAGVAECRGLFVRQWAHAGPPGPLPAVLQLERRPAIQRLGRHAGASDGPRVFSMPILEYGSPDVCLS